MHLLNIGIFLFWFNLFSVFFFFFNYNQNLYFTNWFLINAKIFLDVSHIQEHCKVKKTKQIDTKPFHYNLEGFDWKKKKLNGKKIKKHWKMNNAFYSALSSREQSKTVKCCSVFIVTVMSCIIIFVNFFF